MKKILLLLICLPFAACGVSENCVKSTGSATIRNFETEPFHKIMVFPGIALVIKQGDMQEIRVESGRNIIDDIQVNVIDGMLRLKDESGCNLVRAYGATTVYVTAPNIEEIYSNTEKDIRSDGPLTHPILRLFSMDFFEGTGTGDFYIEVDNSQLVVQSNHVSAFYIKGRTNQLLLHFYDGIGRFEGAELLADDVVIFQRGSNDMVVHPLESISGDIYSTGNVICKSNPAQVHVNEHYSGRLIFD